MTMSLFQRSCKRTETEPYVDESSEDKSYCSHSEVMRRLDVMNTAPRRLSLEDVHPHQLEIGEFLGEGSFATVHTAKVVSDSNKSCESSTTSLAIKRVRQDINGEMASIAATDMIFELEILSRLPAHTNIIGLVGVSKDFSLNPMDGFLLFDQAHETLSQKLSWWSTRAVVKQRARLSFGNPLLHRSWTNSKHMLQLRSDQNARISESAMGIASALNFLHQNGIVYRDLKPSNVAFTRDGTVKLIDFGMARPVVQDTASNSCRISGMAGTARFMAPEIALGLSYGFAVDAYSFSVLLYQICTLAMPFDHVKSREHWFRTVVEQGRRPKLTKNNIPSPILRQLIEAGWSADPQSRPSFDSIQKTLRTVVTDS